MASVKMKPVCPFCGSKLRQDLNIVIRFECLSQISEDRSLCGRGAECHVATEALIRKRLVDALCSLDDATRFCGAMEKTRAQAVLHQASRWLQESNELEKTFRVMRTENPFPVDIK